MAEAGTSECENQKTIISNLLKTPLKKGDSWYLIDTKWLKQWKKYVGFDSWDTSFIGEQSAFPGPIDNSSLFKEGSPEVLKENLIDELEYMLVPEEAWTKMLGWYGIAEGQKQVARQVIEQGMFVKHCKVEVYLMDLKMCLNRDMENILTKPFSRSNTIEDIDKVIRHLFDVAEDKPVRLWNKYMSNTFEHLSKLESTVQDAGLYQNQVIVLEEQNANGTWPRNVATDSSSNTYNNQQRTGGSGETSTAASNRLNHNYSGSAGSSSYNYSSNYDSSYSSNRSNSSPSTPGLCGLSNLGNTCFMNSAIQCMSNVPELTDYFLTANWQSELNVDNPLGMHGEIATSYAELIRNMWSGNNSYTVPRNFKVAVGRFAPQFSGYQQQDSQELMAFLLDGLHEDLNRIKKKPYVEQTEEEGRPDRIVAEEAWVNYKKRNNSIIVDIFHGQLKSTLVCPQCEKVSVTFDPFCYLSLPLPDKKERFIEVFFVPKDPMLKPKHYKLTVPQRGTVDHLRKALAKLNKVTPDLMVVTDVYNRRFHKLFPPEEPLKQITDRDDIFIYEIPCEMTDTDTMILPVYMRERKVTAGYNGYTKVAQQLFGQPLLVAVPRNNCSYPTLYNNVLNKMVRYVKIPDDTEEWWKKPASKKTSGSTISNGDMDYDDTASTPVAAKPTASSSSSSNSSSSSSVEKMENGTNDNASASATTVSPEDVDVEEDEEDEDEEGHGGGSTVDEAGNPCPPRLFTFQLVNSFGTTEMEKMPADDGKAKINFSSRSYLAIDWHPRAKALFYDEKASEELEVDDSVNQRGNNGTGSSGGPGRKQSINLTECLDMFTTTEKLGEQDPWYCPKCKKHQRATKKFDLWRLPHVLVIHLKRFSYNSYWRDKLDTFIEYPTTELDMQKWVIGDKKKQSYDLVAVCNHYGGMGGGHYTAYGKNKEDGSWYYFDDSSVSSAQQDSAVTKAGYVLVYRLRDDPNAAVATAAATAEDASINNHNNSSSNNSSSSRSSNNSSRSNSSSSGASNKKSSRASPPSATVSAPPPTTNVDMEVN